MNSICKITLQKSVLQKLHLMPSCCLSKVSILNSKILTCQISASCCQCGGIIAGAECLSQDRPGLHHLLSPTRRWPLIGRSASVCSFDLKTTSSLPGSTPTSDHSFSISRNFSTTRQTFSASSPVEAAVLAAGSTSTSRQIIFGDFFPVYGAEKSLVYFHQITG